MGRLMAIDYGKKRCGIAVTDPLRIVANPLATVETARLIDFVRDYVRREEVDAIIVGEPLDMHGNPSESQRFMRPGIGRLRQALPDMVIELFDERFTSVLAHRAMLDGGLRRMDRRDKALVDRISASIILNDYLAASADSFNTDTSL